ncbi:MAG: hypothetical protein JNL79_28905 [Myxococcales bacterium]|nr:hypothetical protein [Myxococcales bacterium]
MSDPEARVAPTTRLRRRALRGLQIVAGLAVGVVLAEGIFRLRDRGAFPHLNLYRPDADLGVRLRPSTTQKLAVGKNNPITSVTIDAEGYRALEAPGQPRNDAPAGVLAIGDSQVFGLGVEGEQTFVAELGRLTGKAAYDGGVPTYGPAEYQVVLDELLARKKPAVVVYVVNFANDLFEANRPNKTRHFVWDGWAVRAEAAPASWTEFPGRTWLFRDSHAFFWLRRAVARFGPGIETIDFRSEGNFADLVLAGKSANAAHGDAQTSGDKIVADWEKSMAEITSAADDQQKKLADLAFGKWPDLAKTKEGAAYQKGKGNPGDIVSERVILSEAATGPGQRIQELTAGAKIRARVEEIIRKRAEEAADAEESKAILATFEERARLEKRIAALRALPLRFLTAASPLAPWLEKAKKSCDAHKARLIVVALPLDVQVSPTEFAKYGVGVEDTTPTMILLRDLVQTATALGIASVDATAPLAAAEPGAFLDGDLHMTPKGHAALAKAVFARLALPDPQAPKEAPPRPVGLAKLEACAKAEGSTTPIGLPDYDCLRTYLKDCKKLLACQHGEASAKPKCLPGQSNGGKLHRCFQTCTESKPVCKAGTCTETSKGVSLCM